MCKVHKPHSEPCKRKYFFIVVSFFVYAMLIRKSLIFELTNFSAGTSEISSSRHLTIGSIVEPTQIFIGKVAPSPAFHPIDSKEILTHGEISPNVSQFILIRVFERHNYWSRTLFYYSGFVPMNKLLLIHIHTLVRIISAYLLN